MQKYDVFISYRRDGGSDAAKHLRDTLTELGYSVFYDVESLRAGAFNVELYRVIENCQDVLLMLPPNALDRCVDEEDWVRKEIEHALKCGKNVIPVLMRGFDFPAELPASIEPIRYLNGIAANIEYYDAFVEKLREFMKAKPRLRGGKLYGVIAALLALCVLASVFGVNYFNRYPRTRREENLVSQLITYLVVNTTILDKAEGVSVDALDRAANYLEGKSMLSEEDMLQMLDGSIGQVQEMYGELVPMENALAAGLADSPFDAGDIDGFMPYVNIHLASVQERLEIVQEIVVSKDVPLELRLEHLETLEEVAGLDGEQIYCAMNETLLPVNQAQALARFKTEYWPAMTTLDSGNVFLTDLDQIQGLSTAAFNKQKAALDKLNGYYDEAESRLAAMFANLLEQQKIRATASEEELAQLRQEYESLKQQLEQKKLEAYEKFRPLESDDTVTLWNKGNRFNVIKMYDAAAECYGMFVEKAADPDEKIYGTAAMRFAQSVEETGVTGGVVVCLYEEGLPKQPVEIGDVIYAVNDVPVKNFTEYSAECDKAETVVVSILRFMEEGFELTSATLDSSCGRIGLWALLDEPD